MFSIEEVDNVGLPCNFHMQTEDKLQESKICLVQEYLERFLRLVEPLFSHATINYIRIIGSIPVLPKNIEALAHFLKGRCVHEFQFDEYRSKNDL